MKILLVDDNEEIRKVLILQLELDSIRVIESNSGNNALEVLEKDDTFDLIISDFHMPNGDGKFLVGQMIRMGLDVPVFIFTSEIEPEIIISNSFPITYYSKFQLPLMIRQIENMAALKRNDKLAKI